MIKNLLKMLIGAMAMTLLLNSCYYDKFQELHPILNTACDSATATYSGDVNKIVNAYCIGCHGSSGSGGVSLNSYDNIKAAAANNKLMNALTGTGVPSMPPNTHLDDCKIGSIKHWIQNGMPND